MALLVLLTLALLTDIVTAQECYNGGIQFIVPTEGNNQITGRVQVCRNNQWATLCRVGGGGGGGEWDIEEAGVTCRQLGYTHEGAFATTPCLPMIVSSTYARIYDCGGEENSLVECTLQSVDYERNCHNDRRCRNTEREHPMITCTQADCDGEIRLVGGSTNREGRVEVCMDGRWGTVCNNSQEGIAGAVCSQLGFPAEGARAVSRFGPGTIPIYNCTVNEAGTLHCSLTVNCDRSMELGVVCPTYQDIVERVINRTINETRMECTAPPSALMPTCPTATTQSCDCPTTRTEPCPTAITQSCDCPTTSNEPCPTASTQSCDCPTSNTYPPANNTTSMSCDCSELQTVTGDITNTDQFSNVSPDICGLQCSSTVLGAPGAVIGVLLVLLVALVIGWTVSCVVVLKRNSALKAQDSNLNEYNSEPSTIRQLNNPVYDTNEQPHPPANYSASGPAYEVVEANEGAEHAYDVINRNTQRNVPRKTADSANQDPGYSVLGQATGGEEHNYHVLEGPQVSAYEVPMSGHAHSRV